MKSEQVRQISNRNASRSYRLCADFAHLKLIELIDQELNRTEKHMT